MRSPRAREDVNVGRVGVIVAACATLNTNDYYMQPVSGQLEIQSTLRILDAGTNFASCDRGNIRGRKGLGACVTLAVIFTLR